MKYKKTAGDYIFITLSTLIMAIACIITFYPFIYMLMLSFSSGTVYGKVLLWPHDFDTTGYYLMVTKVKFFSGLLVSVLRSTIGPVLTIAVSFMAGYTLSREDFWRSSLVAGRARFVMFDSIAPL